MISTLSLTRLQKYSLFQKYKARSATWKWGLATDLASWWNKGSCTLANSGVLTFSKCLARSVAPRVRVNVLAPGWIETAFGEELDATTYEAVAMSTPLGRWGTPDDVAAAAVFLASDDARFMTGQTLLVGGGLVM
jgi:3-oxoacyl-[acyl-carrier protein] reductase